VTCSFSQALASPFILLSNTLQQIKQAVLTGSGVWSFSVGLKDLITNTLIVATQNLGSFVLEFFSLIDCIICAIVGNVVSDLCQSVIFRTFRPLVILLQQIAALLIGLSVDFFFFVASFLAHLLSGQLLQAATDIASFFKEFLTTFLVPFLQLVWTNILSALGICGNWWNTIFSSAALKCTDAPGNINGMKRAGSPPAYVIPAYHPYAFQLFAADWPTQTTYTWPQAHPCNARMALLANDAANNNLTLAEAKEADYCLSLIVLYNTNLNATSGDLPYSLDACDDLMGDYLMENMAYTAMSAVERASAKACMSDRAYMHSMKRAAGGPLDFLPSNLMASSGGGFSLMTHVVPMVMDIWPATQVSHHRANDMRYLPQVLAGRDYQGLLKQSYGEERVQLVQQALQGQQGSYMDYAQALFAGSASKKRGASPGPYSPTRLSRVAGMAAIYDAMWQTADPTQLIPSYLSMVATHVFASSPPPLTVINPTTGLTSVETTEAIQALDPLAPANTANDAISFSSRQMNTVMARMKATGFSIFFNLIQHSAATGGSNQVPESLVSAIAANAPPARKRTTSALQEANSTVTTTMRLVSMGLRGLATAARELVTGRARANATNTVAGSVVTAFKWVKPDPNHNESASAVYYAMPGTTPATGAEDGRPITLAVSPTGFSAHTFVGQSLLSQWKATQRAKAIFSDRMSMYQEAAANVAAAGGDAERLSRNPTERSRRLGVVWSSIVNLWQEVTTGNAPTISAYKGSPLSAAASNTSAQNNTGCLINNTVLCTECFYLAQGVGYTVIASMSMYQFYTSTSPQSWNQINSLSAVFLDTLNYLNNESLPCRVGNSSTLSVASPELGQPFASYFDDTMPKVGFGDIQTLITATWNFIKAQIDALLGSPSSIITTVKRGAGAAAAPLRLVDRQKLLAVFSLDEAGKSRAKAEYKQKLAEWNAASEDSPLKTSLPKPMPPEYTATHALGPLVAGFTTTVMDAALKMMPADDASSVGSSSVDVSDFIPVPGSFNTTAQVFEAWINWLFYQYISCNYTTDLNGTNWRTSFTLAFFLVGILAIVVVALLTQIPYLGPIITSTFGGGFAIFIVIGIIFSTSTSWSLLCGPALPPALFLMDMQQLTQVWTTQCLVWGAGLINQDYNNNVVRIPRPRPFLVVTYFPPSNPLVLVPLVRLVAKQYVGLCQPDKRSWMDSAHCRPDCLRPQAMGSQPLGRPSRPYPLALPSQRVLLL
jgi:hypothetical protein